MQWETPSHVRLKLMHSPFAHANLSCARQEEFTAGEGGEGSPEPGPGRLYPLRPPQELRLRGAGLLVGLGLLQRLG